MTKYTGNGNAKFNISYHIVWIPKYRKHIINEEIESRLKEILHEKSLMLNINIVTIECMLIIYIYLLNQILLIQFHLSLKY